MCGRYTVTASTAELQQAFAIDDLQLVAGRADVSPRYNVAPTQDVPIVRRVDEGGDGRRALAMLRWGLIPFWAKDASIAHKAINARAETVAEKPAFKSAMQERRCLVLADGFYEWKKLNAKSKQPYRILVDGGAPFAFAGLWERARIDGVIVETCTFMTTEANDGMQGLHDRMPVILDDEAQYARWLDPTASVDDLLPLLDGLPPARLSMYPVDPRVGSPKFEDPACVARAVDLFSFGSA